MLRALFLLLFVGLLLCGLLAFYDLLARKQLPEVVLRRLVRRAWFVVIVCGVLGLLFVLRRLL